MKLLASKLVAVLAGLIVASMAHAAPVNWYLHDVTFNDGGSATGSFSIDSVTGGLLSYNIVTTGGSLQAGYTYDDVGDSLYCQNCYGGSANNFLLVHDGAGNYGDPFLHFNFTNSLLVSSINELTLGDWMVGSVERNNYDNNHTRLVTSGYASGSQVAEVPEPTSLALLGLGLFGMAGLRRRKLS